MPLFTVSVNSIILPGGDALGSHQLELLGILVNGTFVEFSEESGMAHSIIADPSYQAGIHAIISGENDSESMLRHVFCAHTHRSYELEFHPEKNGFISVTATLVDDDTDAIDDSDESDTE